VLKFSADDGKQKLVNRPRRIAAALCYNNKVGGRRQLAGSLKRPKSYTRRGGGGDDERHCY
jgi:hypothetical protein